ncbi:MAG: glucokinase [Cardiobacteriaceae bacterium]|nr:glucokinase [Cardiobacteriaceae bacterium]
MNKDIALIADCGATNARFALLNLHSGEIFNPLVLQCRDFADLAAACAEYLDCCEDKNIANAAIAIANPLLSEEIKLENNHWHFSRNSVRVKLNLENLFFINDFAAQALAISHISEQDKLLLHGDMTTAEDLPQAVLGPGTGLGLAILHQTAGKTRVIATEGGHHSFSPQNEEEIAILRFAREELGRRRITNEDFLSGKGIELLYKAELFSQKLPQNSLTAAEITTNALQGDAFAIMVLQRFCGLLGSFAADTALATGTRGGIYLCGGILPRIEKILKKSEFCARFDAADGNIAQYLQPIPIYLVRNNLSGLIGAAEFMLEKYAAMKLNQNS